MNRETCQGCPIEECRVETDGLCNKCDDIDEWLADHDKQIRDEAIEEFAEKIREYSGKHYVDCDGYFGGCSELIFKTEDWLDDIVVQMKGEQNE